MIYRPRRPIALCGELLRLWGKARRQGARRWVQAARETHSALGAFAVNQGKRPVDSLWRALAQAAADTDRGKAVVSIVGDLQKGRARR